MPGLPCSPRSPLTTKSKPRARASTDAAINTGNCPGLFRHRSSLRIRAGGVKPVKEYIRLHRPILERWAATVNANQLHPRPDFLENQSEDPVLLTPSAIPYIHQSEHKDAELNNRAGEPQVGSAAYILSPMPEVAGRKNQPSLAGSQICLQNSVSFFITGLSREWAGIDLWQLFFDDFRSLLPTPAATPLTNAQPAHRPGLGRFGSIRFTVSFVTEDAPVPPLSVNRMSHWKNWGDPCH
ncbi:hypothetical protein S40285_10055 [Stachybotrys chlorohalonatus IBT 40285]|uniref:Uncharacterized protein n=1 Tax=Stachybotrys chlorohalonatus (strain IBT 40285) TaxID=1283841 RepID=A0A084QT43_STAC4|nr:hypothetical protein S40285_10055 [Stachybotrys chlorohalonata IBT 40285]